MTRRPAAGGLRAFADYRTGRPEGVRVVWDVDGREILRERIEAR